MRRKGKKIIAAALSALMVLSAMPFTALAAKDNYGTQNPTITATYYSGAFDVKAATTTATNVKLSDDSVGPLMCEPMQDLSTVKAGQAFAVTFWLSGIDTVSALGTVIDYDKSKVQPLYVVGEKSGARYNCKLAGKEEALSKDNGTNKIVDVSMDETYSSAALYGQPDTQFSKIDDPMIAQYTNHPDNIYIVMTTLTDDGFAVPNSFMDDYHSVNSENPEEQGGTQYDACLLITVNMMAMVDSPSVSGPDSVFTVWGGLDAAKNDMTFVEGWRLDKLYTCYKDLTSETYKNEPGAGKFLVLGQGDRASEIPVVTEHTVTYKDASGATISTEKVEDGKTAASVPQLPAMTHDADGHTTYSWDGDTAAAIKADVTFTQVATTAAHSWGSGEITKQPTHTEDGATTYTCTVCSEQKVEAIAATGHTPGTTPVSNNDGTHSYKCTEDGAVTSTENCTYTSVVTAPTCTDQGYTTYTCTKCGYSYVSDYTEVVAHSWSDWAHDAASTGESSTHSRTCSVCSKNEKANCQFTSEVTQQQTTVLPEITTYTCSVCGYQYNEETKPALGHTHNYGAPVADYTSGEAFGDIGSYTHTATCTGEGTCSQPTKTDACTFNSGVVTKQATCTKEGVTTYTCTTCGGTYTAAIPALGHNTLVATDSGSDDTHNMVCQVCGDVVETAAHNYGAGVVEKPATIDEAGVMKYTCADCNHVKTESIPMLASAVISVTGTDKGTITLNGEDATNGANVKLALGDTFTLTAQANADSEFVGWQQGNKIISADTTYTGSAFADMTYTPVFIDKVNQLQFVWVDMYNNVIKTQVVNSASEAVAPQAPVFAGYTFNSWTADATACTESTTIYAKYDADVVTTYTVTAADCTITDGTTTANGSLAVPFDTQVTVSNSSATAWKVGDATVAYGDSYTFFVGSDITVTPVTDVVTAAPATAIVSSTLTSAGGYQVQFLATRSVPTGYTLVQAGFVYGKNMTSDDLTLDKLGQKGSNSNSGNVKAVYMSRTTADAQFSLTYGVSAKNAPATAKAFLIVKDGNGNMSTIYSDMNSYSYGN